MTLTLRERNACISCVLGTLTQNEMVFKRLHLGTVAYGLDSMDEVQSHIFSIYTQVKPCFQHLSQWLEVLITCYPRLATTSLHKRRCPWLSHPPLPSKRWDCRSVLPHLAHVELGN